MNNKSILVIDSNAMAYRSLYTTGGLSNSTGKTGVIFGFLHQTFKFAKQYKSNNIIFCWDSKESLRRILYDKNYKANRIEKRKELNETEKKVLLNAFDQFDKLRKEVLFELGFRNVFSRRGYESDDLVAVIVKENKDKKYIIISNDNDLWQLINKNVKYLGLQNGKVITEESFIKEYKIKPIQWAEVKAIAGCKGDNVIGIKGVGEKKAIDYILKRSKPNDKIKIDSNRATILFNRSLVTLPWKGNIELKIKENKFTANKFIEVFNEYDFKSFLDKNYFDKLKEVFF